MQDNFIPAFFADGRSGPSRLNNRPLKQMDTNCISTFGVAGCILNKRMRHCFRCDRAKSPSTKSLTPYSIKLTEKAVNYFVHKSVM